MGLQGLLVRFIDFNKILMPFWRTNGGQSSAKGMLCCENK